MGTIETELEDLLLSVKVTFVTLDPVTPILPVRENGRGFSDLKGGPAFLRFLYASLSCKATLEGKKSSVETNRSIFSASLASSRSRAARLMNCLLAEKCAWDTQQVSRAVAGRSYPPEPPRAFAA